MEPPPKGDDDDLVDTDTDRETNNEESEEIYRIEESKKYHLESDRSETNERDQRKHPELLILIGSQKIGDDYDPVDTDIDMEPNVTKNTELSTSTLVARKLTENLDDMVDAEE